MRLSKLHIAGFKSFCDRSELGFDDGVTAIVGPNGCGKSNVVDAITWVLGEQSAKSLRGERMEDVIFNGSEARKPTATAEVRLKFTQVAQAAMAAATVVDADPLLDDTPISTRDVEIGRRLYRSGESEYLIDGEVCRLKDIHELLMDSGLGVKAYAVIEQGKIGQILSSRPAERRMLIEEAAGVTKYKSRRRAAELKLEAAQQNLTRVDDIVFEVEKQRGVLKRQAARARRYKRLREELRKWEQVQFARKYDALAQDIEASAARLNTSRQREAEAAATLAALEAALESLRIDLTEAESRSTAIREQAHSRELAAGRRQQQIEFERQQVDDQAQQAAAFAAEASELEERREPAERAIAERREAADRARQALQEIGARVARHQAEYAAAYSAVQAVEQTADTTRAAVLSANTTLAALRQARDHAAAVRDRVAAERERLEIEARDLSAEADRVRAEGQRAADALTEVREALERIRNQRAATESALGGHRASREQLLHARGARERELAGAEARLRSLEQLDASRATFGDAAKFFLASATQAVRQHGAVADHLKVDRSFERAVDALLGELLQYVLVETPDDVVAGLKLLTAENVGRCGFVVLHDSSDDAAGATLSVPSGARALSDVVHTTGPHAQTLARVLGQALIVESFEDAQRVAGSTSVPVATLAGEVFRGAHLVQGGTRRDARGILETRAEIDALRDEVAAIAAAVAEIRQELQSVDRHVAEAEAALAGLVTQQHASEKEIVGHEAQVRRTTDEAERVARRLNVVQTDRARADEEHASTEARREAAVLAIEAHEEQQRGAEVGLSEILGQLQTAREESEVRLHRVTEARAEQGALTERVLSLEADVVRLEEAARELDQRVVSRRNDVVRTEQRRAELRASIADAERALDEDIRVLDDLKDTMREVDEHVVDLRGQFGERDQRIRSARHALDEVRADVLQSEVAQARASADLTHLGATCLETVGLSLDDVRQAVARMQEAGELTLAGAARAARSADVAEPGESDEEMEGEAAVAARQDAEEVFPAGEEESTTVNPDSVIADLRAKIDRLGPVNMMAIEQFDELEARHTFLTTQRQDLLDSIAQTGEAIRKIDKTTRERFAEAFEAINRFFEKTFTTLFGGGRAGLTLIDNENDPETGIDIIAQPPGKRLQNVQLLSGGEKALTAMALMFSIFKYRPSPFCLLDEIDAPLDDANIGRFVEMLQGMREHTQFILITHNRKTMEIANRLYGVTMEEPGVSKLISLQLN